MLVAPQQHDLWSDFRKAIESGLDAQNDWHAGSVYLALIDCWRGNITAAETRLTDLLNAEQPGLSPVAAWVIASDLHLVQSDELAPVIIRLLSYVAETQQNGRVLLKSGGTWDESSDYLLARYLARTNQKAPLEAAIARLGDRRKRQTSNESLEYERTPAVVLADELRELVPTAARRVLEFDEQREERANAVPTLPLRRRTVDTPDVVQEIQRRFPVTMVP